MSYRLSRGEMLAFNMAATDDKTQAILAREKDRRLAAADKGMAAPVNQIPLEQNNMWMGPIDIKEMAAEGSAYLLVKGRENMGPLSSLTI